MTYAYKNLRVTAMGKIYKEQDDWSCTLHIGYTNKDWEYSRIDGRDETNEPIVAAFKKWFQSVGAGISPKASLDAVKFSIIDLDGKFARDGDDFEYSQTYDFAPVYGGFKNPYGPDNIAPQLTVAITLESTVARGRGRYGRIYPPLSGEVSDLGLDSYPGDKADAAKTLIDDINDVMNSFYVPGDPAVIVASAAGLGKNAKVKRVKVGQVIDTQRRRRNNIPENYTTREVQGFNLG